MALISVMLEVYTFAEKLLHSGHSHLPRRPAEVSTLQSQSRIRAGKPDVRLLPLRSE